MDYNILVIIQNETKIIVKINKMDQTETKWAAPQENLSSGFPTKQGSNPPAQLWRLARKLKFCS